MIGPTVSRRLQELWRIRRSEFWLGDGGIFLEVDDAVDYLTTNDED